MRLCSSCVFLCTFLTKDLVQVAEAGGKIKLRLDRFENKEGKKANGEKCDCDFGVCEPGGGCDAKFRICVREWERTECFSEVEDTSPLDNVEVWTYEDGDGYIGDETPNPIVTPFSAWPESQAIQIKIVILDDDPFGEEDIDTVYSQRILLSPARAKDFTRPMTLRNRASVTLRVKAYCDPGYSGLQCTGKCLIAEPDKNNFRCNPFSVGGERQCVPGLTGEKCDTEIDECASNPCQRTGTCIDLRDGYNCICPTGYTGTNCEAKIDYCDPNPCNNSGTCIDGINSYSCQCEPGFTGVTCDVNINECGSNPCINGNCIDKINTFHCICEKGYSGVTCNERSQNNPCMSLACYTLGTCRPVRNTCECRPGITGRECEVDIDDCASDPCQSNGNCTDMVNSYKCICFRGYIGRNCFPRDDPCAKDPCAVGSTCTSQNKTSHCECAPGRTGATCHEGIEECVSGPCLNGGTCIDLLDGFECDCPPEYIGKLCDRIVYDLSSVRQPLESLQGISDSVRQSTVSAVQGSEEGHPRDIETLTPVPGGSIQHTGYTDDAGTPVTGKKDGVKMPTDPTVTDSGYDFKEAHASTKDPYGVTEIPRTLSVDGVQNLFIKPFQNGFGGIYLRGKYTRQEIKVTTMVWIKRVLERHYNKTSPQAAMQIAITDEVEYCKEDNGFVNTILKVKVIVNNYELSVTKLREILEDANPGDNLRNVSARDDYLHCRPWVMPSIQRSPEETDKQVLLREYTWVFVILGFTAFVVIFLFFMTRKFKRKKTWVVTPADVD